MMRGAGRWGAVGGALVSPIFVVVVVLLTFAESDFLRKSGWSAVHRTPVEWPSLLALGPEGAVLVVTFVVCGVLVAAFGGTLLISGASSRVRIAGLALMVAGLALALESFKVDPPDSGSSSWHDTVHNAAYPLIPLGAVVGAAVLSFGANRPAWNLTRRLSGVALVIFVVALSAAYVDGVAQIARYFLFGAMLVWLEALALDAFRTAGTSDAG